MTDPSHLPRVYGEQEIGRILKRATELQHHEPTAPTAAGMTLDELQEIAAEAGIAPDYVRRAALEVDSGRPDHSFWADVVGADLNLIRETTLQGEVRDDGFERIAAAVQTASREHGQPSLLGRTLTWRAETSNKTRTIQLVVTSRDGETWIRLEENLGQLAAGLFGGTIGGAGLGLGLGLALPLGLEVLGSTLLAVAGPIGMVGLTYLASREIYRGVVRRRRRVFSELFDTAVAEARASIASKTGGDGTAAGALPPG